CCREWPTDLRGSEPEGQAAGRYPRILSAVAYGEDGIAWPLQRRGRIADYRAAGSGPAQWRSVASGHPVGVDGGTLDDRNGLRARHRPDESAPDGAGTADADPRAAERLQSPNDASAGFLSQPSHEHRPEFEVRFADRNVGSGTLEYCTAPC